MLSLSLLLKILYNFSVNYIILFKQFTKQKQVNITNYKFAVNNNKMAAFKKKHFEKKL